MRWLVFLFSLTLWAVPPLQVVSVNRVGLPPYENGDKVYRLEGEGCATLKVGEMLVLQRDGERRALGRLEVTAVHVDHADARLIVRGETFPLKGDLAVRTAPIHPLPDVPVEPDVIPIPTLALLKPTTITRALPKPASLGPTHREPIYFIKGDASLSPGALTKLSSWVEEWGTEGQWSLECPQSLSTLLQERVSALRTELERLGVPKLEIHPLPEDNSGKYDAIYVMKEP
jgi:hypothetical protein